MCANEMSILDLNNDCLLQIMKFIIDDCNLREEPLWISRCKIINTYFQIAHKNIEGLRSSYNRKCDLPYKYADIEAFAMAHENINELLRIYFKEIYYHRELTMLAISGSLTIDFAEIQSQIADQNMGDDFWNLYTKAIRENTQMYHVKLIAHPESAYPEFTKHFQMIKCALENKRSLGRVQLELNGYSLDHLNIFGKLSHLYLDARLSSEALVSVCQSNPGLLKLQLRVAVNGSLSDIVPHCHHLERLEFVSKPGVDGAEYALLARLPNLREITIHQACINGSQLTMLEAIQNCQRTRMHLTVHFVEELPHMSYVRIVTSHLLQSIKLTRKLPGIELRISYDFWKLSKDNSHLEQSFATMNLIAASFEINWSWRTLWLFECPTLDIDIRELISQLKLFNINGLFIPRESQINSQLIAKLFKLMVPERLSALKSIVIHRTDIDLLTTLLKIKSITFLKCTFSDWKPIDLLSDFFNLESLNIAVEKKFDKTSSRALCNLLNTCKVHAVINCIDWRIEFKKNEKVSGPNNDIAALRILDVRDLGSLSQLFEAFEVNRVHAVKKLKITSDAYGIEGLAKLIELDHLTITNTTRGPMIRILDQLATEESPALQCLSLSYDNLSTEEVIKLARKKSLKNLELFGPIAENSASMLANLNIEKLTCPYTRYSTQKLLAAFAAKTTNRLQHLNVMDRRLDLMELEQLSKLKDLKSLGTKTLNSETVPFLQNLKRLEELYIKEFEGVGFKLNLPSIKKLHISGGVRLNECQFLPDLENLESLYLGFVNNYDSDNYDDHFRNLTEIKNLKELKIPFSKNSLKNVYHAFACKRDLKLTHLNTVIVCAQELNEITRIKSLQELHLSFDIISGEISDLGQLTELRSLYIEFFELDSVFVLTILKSCKNINRCTIRYMTYEEENIVSQVHRLLKSIRDPTIQMPLTLTILNRNLCDDQFNQLVYLDDAYLKVYYTF